jgi:H+/Cl- antiporter ClcA
MTQRGFLLQFFGAAFAIISGHSVGREGPHVYLGAAAASLFGQRLDLPNNSIRTLVACGTAAGIAASFNTPLAGVIFALEVVMMEYSVASFIPVILAAVSATALSNAVLGFDPAFTPPDFTFANLAELPIVFVLGIAAGSLAVVFNLLLHRISAHSQTIPIWWRMLLAGVLMGCAGLLLPEVMGIGYDSLSRALLGEYGVLFLLLLIGVKLLATTTCIGLGVPGGMIGPTLFLGGCLGSLTGLLAGYWFGVDTPVGFYALLGMGAMMGASLQAPLAALVALVELTQLSGTIMPGMLVVVVASLTASEFFHQESLFITMLKSAGMDYQASPVLQALRRTGVASVMNANFVRTTEEISLDSVRTLLASQPDWILVDVSDKPGFLLPAVDLARALNSLEEELEEPAEHRIDLSGIPAERLELAPVELKATLQEALEIARETQSDALYVKRMTAPGIERIYGILTRGRLESAYGF